MYYAGSTKLYFSCTCRYTHVIQEEHLARNIIHVYTCTYSVVSKPAMSICMCICPIFLDIVWENCLSYIYTCTFYTVGWLSGVWLMNDAWWRAHHLERLSTTCICLACSGLHNWASGASPPSLLVGIMIYIYFLYGPYGSLNAKCHFYKFMYMYLKETIYCSMFSVILPMSPQVSAATVEVNVKVLNLSSKDLNLEVDPLFKQMFASFDEGHEEGFMLCQLITR